MDQLLCFVREFQTLIVGTIGFVGVIFTIYKNSSLAREQRNAVRNHDKQALRTAIYSELTSIRSILKTRAQDLKGHKDSGCLLPETIPTSVFDSLQTQIGILEIEEISLIIKTYLLIKELPIRLKVISVESGSSGAYEGYIFIGSKYLETAGTMHENFILTVDEALNAIKF